MLLGPVSSNNKQDQSSTACNINIKYSVKDGTFCAIFLVAKFRSVVIVHSCWAETRIFHAHFKVLSPYFVASKEFFFSSVVGTESRFRDPIVRLMSSCYPGLWILTHVLSWISNWLSSQLMSVPPPPLSIVLISSNAWCELIFYCYRNISSWKPDPINWPVKLRIRNQDDLKFIWYPHHGRLAPPPPSLLLQSTWNCKQRNTERCDAIQTLI